MGDRLWTYLLGMRLRHRFRLPLAMVLGSVVLAMGIPGATASAAKTPPSFVGTWSVTN